MVVIFDTFHFDTSGFADAAPSNINPAFSTFDISQFVTFGFAFVVFSNIPFIFPVFEVLIFSAPIRSPLNPKNIWLASQHKLTSPVTVILPSNGELSHTLPEMLPPIAPTNCRHFHLSISLLPFGFNTLIFILPSSPIAASIFLNSSK